MKVVLKNQISHLEPGTEIMVYGFKCIVQANQTMIADLPPHIAEMEHKSGRFVILETPEEPVYRPVMPESDGYSYPDPKNAKATSPSRKMMMDYVKVGDLAKITETLERWRRAGKKKLLMDFAEDELRVSFPIQLTTNEMAKEITALIDEKFKTAEILSKDSANDD